MKELSIEEKAIAYDKAIEKAKSKIRNDKDHVLYEDDVIEIFPELAEPEDERMKEAIIATIHLYYGEPLEDKAKEMIAWLEKQGKQKPAEWNTNDEQMLNSTIKDLIHPCYEEIPDRIEEEIKWIKSMRNRVVSQPKQQWSEEDELSLKQAIYVCHQNGYTAVENWLKSLRPQNTWKPSDEMLEALYRAIPENVMEKSEDEMLLDKLYQGLKYGRVLSDK